MVEGQDIESSNSIFGNFLDSIDRFSKKIESSINGTNDTQKANNTPIDVVEKSDTTTAKVESQVVEKQIFEDKSSEIIDLLENTGTKISLLLKRVFYNLQYIIPAIIIFQSALWIAYLSKDSVSNGFISTFVDGLGDLGENILRLFSFFGWIIASTISSSLDSQTSFGTFSLHHNVAEIPRAGCASCDYKMILKITISILPREKVKLVISKQRY